MDVDQCTSIARDYERARVDVVSFSSILDDMGDLDTKLKHLWMLVYNNAVNDRISAEMLYTALMIDSSASASQHAMNAPSMIKYLERMCKSNEQLLSLATLVHKYTFADDGDGAKRSNIYDMIDENENA